MEKFLKLNALTLIQFIIFLELLIYVYAFPQGSLDYKDPGSYDSTEEIPIQDEDHQIEKRNANISTSLDQTAKVLKNIGLIETERDGHKDFDDKTTAKNKRSLGSKPIVYSAKYLNKRSIAPFRTMKIRSLENKFVIDEDADVLDDLMNNDINRRYVREAEDEPVKEPAIPLLQMQVDNRTQFNVTVTNATDIPVESQSQLKDILNHIKTKRDIHEENAGYADEKTNEAGQVQKEVEDLEVAESNVVFKPLFRYSSQISQRKKLFRSNYF